LVSKSSKRVGVDDAVGVEVFVGINVNVGELVGNCVIVGDLVGIKTGAKGVLVFSNKTKVGVCIKFSVADGVICKCFCEQEVDKNIVQSIRIFKPIIKNCLVCILVNKGVCFLNFLIHPIFKKNIN
jgi:hypothetical protein